MKRTDKYKDSYRYDDQYQNHRRQSEERDYRNQSQYDDRREYNENEYEQNPERYYNGRDDTKVGYRIKSLS